jgi:hypothetical protein
MDFRTIEPGSVRWAAGPRGPTASLPAGRERVTVQSPACPVKVSTLRPGMLRVQLCLGGAGARRAFARWVEQVEAAAAAAPELAAWRGARARSSGVFRDEMRLTAFSDTPAFDASGRMSAELPSATSAVCILQIQGGWTTDDKWGVRWKIVQLKFSTEPCPAEDEPDDAAEDPAADPAADPGSAAFAFLKDD